MRIINSFKCYKENPKTEEYNRQLNNILPTPKFNTS